MAKKTVEKETVAKPAAKKSSAKSVKKTSEKAVDTKPEKKAPAKKKKAPENKLAGMISKEEQIRLAAYFKWQEKGGQHGSDVEDWLEAENSLTD